MFYMANRALSLCLSNFWSLAKIRSPQCPAVVNKRQKGFNYMVRSQTLGNPPGLSKLPGGTEGGRRTGGCRRTGVGGSGRSCGQAEPGVWTVGTNPGPVVTTLHLTAPFAAVAVSAVKQSCRSCWVR